MAENQNAGDSESPRKDEIAEYYEGVKKMELEGYETGIKKARNALFVTAALTFAGEMISVALSGGVYTTPVIVVALIEAGIFVALAFWTKTKPYSAIITGLILYIGMWILAIVLVGVRAAYGGIVVRLIILAYLINALKHAKAWEQAKRNA